MESEQAKKLRLRREKQKRDEISQGIARLESLVPKELQIRQQQLNCQTFEKTKAFDVELGRTSKAVVLQSSAQYIRQLQNEIVTLHGKIDEYEKKKDRTNPKSVPSKQPRRSQISLLIHPQDDLDQLPIKKPSSIDNLLSEEVPESTPYKLPPLQSYRNTRN